MSPDAITPVTIRELGRDDEERVAFIDGAHTGVPKPEYWAPIFRDYLDRRAAGTSIGLGAEVDGRLVGYLFGEVRAVEFGSEPCGWVFAVGVDSADTRQGIAATLMREAVGRFRAAGVTTVRTMVRRNDVDVLSFFRAQGFVGGSFVQLELDCGGER